jgi:hypothetical protein
MAMADEIGPLPEAFKVVFYNRANLREVRKVAGTSPNVWTGVAAALAGTASDYMVTASQEGATKHYYASLPTGLDPLLSHPVGIYPTDAADIDDTRKRLMTYTPDPQGVVGAYPLTVTVQDEDTEEPIEGAIVRVTAGTETSVAPTNAMGVALFTRNAGTYTVSVTDAVHFGSVTEHVLTSSSSTWALTVDLTLNTVDAPEDPNQTLAYTYTRNMQGILTPGMVVEIQLLNPGLSLDAWDTTIKQVTSNSEALAAVTLWKSSNYQVRAKGGKWVPFATGTGDTVRMPEMIGKQLTA